MIAFFPFKAPATTAIYTLSLHDALPISLDAGGWEDLLRDKDAVIWAAGAGGGNPQRTYGVDRDAAIASMDAAGRGGARRYVMGSYFGARAGHGVAAERCFFAHAGAQAGADQHLRATRLELQDRARARVV